MARSGDEGLEQRLDRWVEAGRQLVDGVSGARPGSRTPARAGSRRAGSRLNPAELGRWVETKLDWLLDDEAADDWREPWQPQRSRLQPAEAEPPSRPSQPRNLQPRNAQSRGRRRPLDAISRRPAAPQWAPAASADAANDWPDDDLFSVPRWQRQAGAARSMRSRDPDPFSDSDPASQPQSSQPQSSQLSPERPPSERQVLERQSRPLPRSSRRR